MKKSIFNKTPRFLAVAVLAAAAGTMSLAPLGVLASSHREAPLISGDPKADGTDFYAFVSPDKPDSATVIANYLPFENPSGGPNFYSFDDNVKYDINIDNNGDAQPDITYSYKFTTTRQNEKTFLYNTGPIKSLDDPNWNVRQTYTLTKTTKDGTTTLGENIATPPSNVGPKSTPDYANLQSQAVKDLGNGVTTFAGQSDDPFYADLGGIFDLLSIRKLPGNAGGGSDGLKGFSVQSLALQIPITDLTSTGTKPADAKDPAAVVGLWTTASRKATTVLSSDGTKTSDGEYVQVSRLGAPLVNEVVVPLAAKDLWNSSIPSGDAQFANGVANPELGTLLKAIYKIKVPPQGDFGSAEQRDDLEAIYLTGIKDLNMPANVVPSEQLRVNLGISSTKNPNRLGVLAKDNQGFPNGRRLADDVVDISEQAVAGAAYPLFHPDFKADPLATQLGDGVNANDKPFRSSFPYLALPDDG
ncbi:DUF4331 domain-containing protein, partial [Polaromonas sp.]|nr:DUF4331 domain-containing protein [Candidatus Saccharibacteria bacterium]